MIQSVRAVYENGVLRPLDALVLDEHVEVQVTVETADALGETIEDGDPFDAICFDGPPDLAERIASA